MHITIVFCYVFFSLSILRGKLYKDHEKVVSACEEMLAGHIRSPFLLAVLVDMYEEDGQEEKRLEAIKVIGLTHCSSI